MHEGDILKLELKGDKWNVQKIKLNGVDAEYVVGVSFDVSVDHPTIATVEFIPESIIIDENPDCIYFVVGKRKFRVVEESQ